MLSEIATGIMGLAVAVFGPYVYERWIRDRVRVIRIKNAKDDRVPALCDLYARYFPDESTDYSPDEVLELLEKQEEPDGLRHVTADDIMLVACFKGEVVGFIFCHAYPERKKAIVSYYAVDKEAKEAKDMAGMALVKRLKRLLVTKGYEYLFFDVKRPADDIEAKENSERKGRIGVLASTAVTLGFQPLALQFDYSSPRINLSTGTKETPLILMVIPLARQNIGYLKKEEVMSFLRFIYLDCYGDIYIKSDPRFLEYHTHLNKRLELIANAIPDLISVTNKWRVFPRLSRSTRARIARRSTGKAKSTAR